MHQRCPLIGENTVFNDTLVNNIDAVTLFFIRTCNILMKTFQPQNVLIWFLFPMKHSNLLMAKITSNVVIPFNWGYWGY